MRLILCLLMFAGATRAAVWEWQNPLPQGNALYDVAFTTPTHGWAVGSAGTISRTTDGGQSWFIQSGGTPQTLRKIAFADALHGWIAGGDDAG